MNAINPVRAVVVRTYSAGVHYGYLTHQSDDGRRVRLERSRRIWHWEGAASLSQLATDGCAIKGSKISVPVSALELSEAIEVIDCSPKARELFDSAPEWRA